MKSLLDNDLYKFTMQQAVLYHYPNAMVEYRFKNRGHHTFTPEFVQQLRKEVSAARMLRLEPPEETFLSRLPFIRPWYLEYLRNFHMPSETVHIDYKDGRLDIRISGPWHLTILWEVPLMAIISQLYFEMEDTSWSREEDWRTRQIVLASSKGSVLSAPSCKFADFGTRRRRSYDVQALVVKELMKHSGFVGTSNVHLAERLNLRPIGTMAHEWVQAISALESLNHANRFMMERWAEFYDGSLGIALTDTYGLDAFLRDFSPRLAKLFDGVRHDSGCPFEFTDKIVAAYQKLGINPAHKTIVFSDGLDTDRALEIRKHCIQAGIGFSFGIGTNFTNDFPDSPALNMVVKLWSIDGMPVVKLSEDAGKANGDPAAIQAVRTIYGV
jgi:nicotinate phosphoribosyltransferase